MPKVNDIVFSKCSANSKRFDSVHITELHGFMPSGQDAVSPRSDSLTTMGSPDRFGYEWNHYAEILPESRQQLQRWLGPITLESFQGKSVLDVGCGMGRNPYWILKAGAARLLAVDYDARSVSAAKKNLTGFPQAQVERKSVYELDPKDTGLFDRVTNIGVLHHLADPPAALQHLWKCVSPGGELIVWVYGKNGNRWIIPFIRVAQFFGSRLPLPFVHLIASVLAAVVWLGIRIAPMSTEYYRFIRRLRFKNLTSIVFDQMIPHIAHYWSEKDIRLMTDQLSDCTTTIHLVQGNSWTFICQNTKKASM